MSFHSSQSSKARRASLTFVARVLLVACACSTRFASSVSAQSPADGARPDAAPANSSQRYSEEFRRGFEALKAGRWADGVASMQRCLEISPEEPNCAYNIACGMAHLGRVDDGVAWFARAAAWGYGYNPFADDVAACLADKDLDPLRGDARFVTALDAMRAYKARVDAFVAAPAVYVPPGLDPAKPLAAIVVLHASGATKSAGIEGRWKRAADELGVALVAPSALFPVARDPSRGMAWFLELADYGDSARTERHEASILPAIDALERVHPIDRTRLVLAGESEGAIVALHAAFARPGVFAGVLADEGALVPALLNEAAPGAHAARLRVRVMLDRADFRARLASDPALHVEADAVLAAWNTTLEEWGFPGSLDAYERAPGTLPGAPKDPADRGRRVTAALKDLIPAAAPVPVPSAPATPR